MMLMAVFLFSVASIKAAPIDEDIGKSVVKTECVAPVINTDNLPALLPAFSFCQRTDMNDFSSVMISCDACTLELIWPIYKSDYNKQVYCRQYNDKYFNTNKDVGKNLKLALFYT